MEYKELERKFQSGEVTLRDADGFKYYTEKYTKELKKEIPDIYELIKINYSLIKNVSIYKEILDHALEVSKFNDIEVRSSYSEESILGLKTIQLLRDEAIDFKIGFFDELDKYLTHDNNNAFYKALLKLKLDINKEDIHSKLIPKDIDSLEKLRPIVKQRIEQLLDYLKESDSILKNDELNLSSNNNTVDKKSKEPNYLKTEFNIPFKANLFKDKYSTKLFCYLIDHYHKGKDKELSNIYQWMENNGFIQENKRKEFKDLVKEHKITKQKYNRVHPSTEYNSTKLNPTFNELQKRFDKEIK